MKHKQNKFTSMSLINSFIHNYPIEINNFCKNGFMYYLCRFVLLYPLELTKLFLLLDLYLNNLWNDLFCNIVSMNVLGGLDSSAF